MISKKNNIMLFSLGLFMVAISVVAGISGRTTGAGALIPVEPEIVWHGPSWEDGRVARKAKVAFVVTNTGDTPVRVESVESGCGCAEPVVEPRTIAPGATGTVSVEASPPDIGVRTVPIILNTDSPVTPAVELNLRMIGYRRPPFILQASGDLTYLGNHSPGDTCEITVHCVEAPEETKTPIVKSSLPFLEVDLIAVNETPYETEENFYETDLVTRTYSFAIRIQSKPDKEVFSGEITVTDPWNESLFNRMIVYGRRNPTLRVFPSRPRLSIESDAHSEARTIIRVLPEDPSADVVVECDVREDQPFIIAKVAEPRSDHFQVFSIQLKPGKVVTPGVHDVIVSVAEDSARSIKIPILVEYERNR